MANLKSPSINIYGGPEPIHHYRTSDDAPITYANRRAYVGSCPEKQTLLTELRQLIFKREGIESRLFEVESRLTQITFVPSYPGEDRNPVDVIQESTDS